MRFSVGSGRITRLVKQIKDNSNGIEYVEPVQKPRSHALKDETIQFMLSFVDKLEVEKGFPCPHRRMKFYILEQGITFAKLHERYINLGKI